jgi:hypothetical protein
MELKKKAVGIQGWVLRQIDFSIPIQKPEGILRNVVFGN